MNPYKIVYGLVIISMQPILAVFNVDLINPKVIEFYAEDLKEIPQRVHFNWYNSKLGCATLLGYDDGTASFAKIYKDVLPKDLSAVEKEFFESRSIVLEGALHNVFIMTCGKTIVPDEEIQRYFTARGNGTTDSYHLAPPLRYPNSMPHLITIPDLVKLLESKRFIFYTGAGISIAAGVSSMSCLEEITGICKDQIIDSLTHVALQSGQIALNPWIMFCEAAFKAEPTIAHKAIAEIALDKNAYIFTENIDVLHERSGVLPFRPTKQNVLDSILVDSLSYLDFIVCIGLSHDDRGFLAYYKMFNPNGLIVAIDIKQPSYLNENDYFLAGDLQQVVPLLKNEIID